MVRTLSVEDNIASELPTRLKSSTMPASATLLNALETIERGQLQIALCLEGSKLVGLVTDGDIRRLIVRGFSLDTPVEKFLSKDYIRVSPSVGRAETLDLMQSLRISHVPIVDKGGRLLGLHLLNELLTPSNLPNEAVILAGGRGTRLRPFTENCPKPMLNVAGRPILERLVLHLAGHGIKRIHLAINYLGSMVETHFGDGSQFGCEISYLREETALGTAGPLSLLQEPPKHPLVVLNGDLVTQIDVVDLIRHHQRSENTLTVGVRLYTHQVPYGCVTLEGQRLRGLVEKPLLTELINAGIYVLNPSLVGRIPAEKSFHMTDLINGLLSENANVGAYELKDDWVDIGQKDQLDKARGSSL